MKIAIALFGTRVSPNFDHAQTVLLVNIEQGRVVQTNQLSLGAFDPIQKAAHIRNSGIEVIICGGISNFIQNILRDHNIRVIPWITGEAEKALDLFMQGSLEPGTMVCKGRRRRWRFCIN